MPESSAQDGQHKDSSPGVEITVSAADAALTVLWQVARDLRSAKTADEVLTLVAKAIAEAGLYHRAVLTLHNVQGDITAIGYHGIPDEVIAATRRARRISEEARRAILDPANKISASYFVPSESGFDFTGEGRYVASDHPPAPKNEWQPDDELFVPITNDRGVTIGYASADTPPDGKRPDLAIIRRLELFVHLASEALGRVRARARLQEVQERVQRLVTHADDVIFRASAVDNVFEFINPAVEKLTGYSVDDLMSRPLDALMVEIVHPDDLNRLVAGWEIQQERSRTSDKEFKSIEYRIRRKDGGIRWVWEKRILICDPDGKALAVEGILRDVTEQHKLRERLAESEQKYRLLAENTRDLVYAHDLEGYMFYISPSVRHFLNAEPEEVINTKISDWLTENPINRAAFEAFDAEVARGETVPPFVLEMRSRTGREFLMEFNESLILDEKGRVLGVQGVGRDVTNARRAEEALKKSEERFRQLADLLPQTVFEVDVNRKVTFINQYGLAAFGYSKGDVRQGLNGMDLLVPKDREKIEKNARRGLEARRLEGNEYTALRKDGSTFPVLVYSTPIIHDNQPMGFRGIALDLTGRKRTEDELKSERDFVRSLLDTANCLIVCLDKDARITVFNRECERVSGYTREEVLGKSWPKMFLPTDHYHHRVGNFADWVRQHPQDILEGTLKTKSGEIRTILWSNSALFSPDSDELTAIAVGRDVTENRRAEKALRESEQRYAAATAAAKTGIWDWNIQSGEFYIDPSVKAILGYRDDEIPNDLDIWVTYVHPDDRQPVMEAAQAHLDGHTPEYAFEHRMLHRDGSVRWILSRGKAIRDDEGRAVRMVGTDVDITERKQVEQALKRSEERLRGVIENMPVMMDAFDEEGNLLAWNRECEQVTGFSAGEMIGNPKAMELLYPDEEYRNRMFAEWAARGNDYHDWEWEMTGKDGSVKTVAWSNISRHFPIPGWATWGIGVDVTERKRAAQALRESEEKFRKMLSSSPHAIAVADLSGRVTGCNQAALDLHGFASREELIGRDAFDLIAPQDRPRAAENMKKTLEQDSMQDIEYTLLTRNGREFRAELSAALIRDSDGNPSSFIAVIRDITARKRAEEALRESEDKYRRLFENESDAVMLFDADTLQFEDANPTTLTLFGYTKDEFLALRVTDISAEKEKTKEAVRKVASGEPGSQHIPLRYMKKKDGTVFPVEISAGTFTSGGRARLIGVIRDITERRRAEEALRRSEEQARAILNATTDSVVLAKPDGTVLAINETGARLLGRTADDLVGRCVFDYMPPAVAESRRARTSEIIRTGKPIRFEDERDGIIFDTSVYPIYDAQGQVEGLAVFARDVTERNRVLRQLRRKSKELDRANTVLAEMVSELHRKNRKARELTSHIQAKNAELQAMVSMLSHDLKTPLVSIRELTGIFRRRYSRLIDEGGQDLARRISSNAANMLRLVDSLLDYARAEDYIAAADDIDLGGLVDDIWEQITDAFPGRRAVLRRPAPFSCRFSRLALERILANLLRNAVAYVPDDRVPEIELDLKRLDNRLRISVADNGTGIPPDQQEKIFELFHRVQPAVSDGSGVGLAVVKRVVDAAGGTITVAPRPEGGAIFTVDLPLCLPESSAK